MLQSERKSKSNSSHNARKRIAYTTPNILHETFSIIYLVRVYVYRRAHTILITISIVYKHLRPYGSMMLQSERKSKSNSFHNACTHIAYTTPNILHETFFIIYLVHVYVYRRAHTILITISIMYKHLRPYGSMMLQSERKSKSNSFHNARKRIAYTTPNILHETFFIIYLVHVYVYRRAHTILITISIMYKHLRPYGSMMLQSERKSKSNSFHNARKRIAYTTPDNFTWDFFHNLSRTRLCLPTRSYNTYNNIDRVQAASTTIRLNASSIRTEIQVKLKSQCTQTYCVHNTKYLTWDFFHNLSRTCLCYRHAHTISIV